MPIAEKRNFDSEALQYTYDRFIAGYAEQENAYEQALVDTEAASLLYDLHTRAGLSQRAMARRAGTTASAIRRLEDADYEGHLLAMLRRVAAALDKRVEIRFVPATRPKRTKSRNVA